jgi:four helix bundle protein
MKESPLRDKSEKFADRILKLHKYLNSQKKEFIMAKQILRSGTSIGANIAEAGFGASTKDFLNKLQISAKECSETLFWLGRLKSGEFITEPQFKSLRGDCLEIGRIIAASAKTTLENIKNKNESGNPPNK